MKAETKLVLVIVVLSLALPIISYRSFWTGYRLWPEVHGRARVVSNR